MLINFIRTLSLTSVVALLCPCLNCSLIEKGSTLLPRDKAGRDVQPTLAAAPTLIDTAIFSDSQTSVQLATPVNFGTPAVSGTTSTSAAVISPAITPHPSPRCLLAELNEFLTVSIVHPYLSLVESNVW